MATQEPTTTYAELRRAPLEGFVFVQPLGKPAVATSTAQTRAGAQKRVVKVADEVALALVREERVAVDDVIRRVPGRVYLNARAVRRLLTALYPRGGIDVHEDELAAVVAHAPEIAKGCDDTSTDAPAAEGATGEEGPRGELAAPADVTPREGPVRVKLVSDDRSGFVCLHTLAEKFHTDNLASTGVSIKSSRRTVINLARQATNTFIARQGAPGSDAGSLSRLSSSSGKTCVHPTTVADVVNEDYPGAGVEVDDAAIQQLAVRADAWQQAQTARIAWARRVHCQKTRTPRGQATAQGALATGRKGLTVP
jgi:hypothetical protein